MEERNILNIFARLLTPALSLAIWRAACKYFTDHIKMSLVSPKYTKRMRMVLFFSVVKKLSLFKSHTLAMVKMIKIQMDYGNEDYIGDQTILG